MLRIEFGHIHTNLHTTLIDSKQQEMCLIIAIVIAGDSEYTLEYIKVLRRPIAREAAVQVGFLKCMWPCILI